MAVHLTYSSQLVYCFINYISTSSKLGDVNFSKFTAHSGHRLGDVCADFNVTALVSFEEMTSTLQSYSTQSSKAFKSALHNNFNNFNILSKGSRRGGGGRKEMEQMPTHNLK